jgi:FkbM family methyltransferase
MKLVNVCGHSFVKDLLRNNAVILDCGANHGDFSRWVAENCNTTVHGFVPDPRLFPKLPSLPNFYFYPVAVSGTGNPLTLRLGEMRCSSVCFAETPNQNATVVKSVRLDEFCQDNSISWVDLIKLDVEGTEIEILRNLPREFLEKVGQITVEFHDFIQRNEVPRIGSVISKMKGYSFLSVKFSHFDYADVLFLNRRLHNLYWWHIALIYIHKYRNGLSRIARRKLRFTQP